VIDLWTHIRLYIPFGLENGCDNEQSNKISKSKKITTSILGWREYITTTIIYQSPQNRGKEIGEEIKITNQPMKELVLPCH
jgi:hypothetical protein